MQRNSALIIGLSIVLGFLLFGLLTRLRGPGETEVGRYQFLRANDVTLAVLDTKTGRVWMKFVGTNTGPVEWSEDGPNVGPAVTQQVPAPQAPQTPGAPKR